MPAVDALVGRSSELAVTASLLDSLARGHGGVLIIEGEPGIGKTRLLGRVLDDAEAMGAVIFSGAAHPLDTTRPFGAVVDALELRRRSPDPARAAIAAVLSGEEGGGQSGDLRPRVADMIVELLEAACGAGPVVLGVEDLHWADDSSLAALGAIVAQLSAFPLLVVATLRPTPRTRSLHVFVDDVVVGGARTIRLESFRPDEVDDLVRTELGGPPGPVLAAIVTRAGGNPLWLIELLRSLRAEGWLRRDAAMVEAEGDELPETFRDLVLRRLRYLPPRTLDVLQLAAVLGDEVSVQDLATVSRRRAGDVLDDLAEAFRARLLDEKSAVVVFRHQLVQQAIYEDIPTPMRVAMHRDAAAALDEAGADVMKIATHLLRGAQEGDLSAVEALRRAGVVALSGSPTVAVELLTRALELAPATYTEADVMRGDLAAALLRAGEVARAAELAAHVLDRPHRLDAEMALLGTLVDALPLLNRGDEVVVRAEAALESPALGDAQRALVLAQASYGQTFSGDLVGAEATARRAVACAEGADSDAMLAWSLCTLAVALKTLGRYDEASERARRAVAVTRVNLDEDARRRHPDFFLGMVLADADQVAEAQQAYAVTLEESSELGSQWLVPEIIMLAGEAHFLRGEWDDAIADLEAGIGLSELHGQRISVPQSVGYLSLMAQARGDLARAAAVLGDTTAQLAAPRPLYGTEIVALADALLRETRGDEVGAFELLLRFWRDDAERAVRYYCRYLGPPLVRLAVRLDRREVLDEVVSGVDRAAELAPGVPTVVAASLRCRGLADRDGDALTEAAALTRVGARLWDHVGTCEDAARVLLVEGRREEAAALLEEALSRYESVAADAAAARVAAALRHLGRGRAARASRPRPGHGWESLTGSERTVSELVAEGLTNREVAQRLHVSPHTVNTHLRHVFQKLGVRTRTELAAYVLRREDHASE